MDRFAHILSILDMSLKTKRKRHIVGGTLFSVSLLFGVLAFTIMTLKEDHEDDGRQNE